MRCVFASDCFLFYLFLEAESQADSILTDSRTPSSQRTKMFPQRIIPGLLHEADKKFNSRPVMPLARVHNCLRVIQDVVTAWKFQRQFTNFSLIRKAPDRILTTLVYIVLRNLSYHSFSSKQLFFKITFRFSSDFKVRLFPTKCVSSFRRDFGQHSSTWMTVTTSRLRGDDVLMPSGCEMCPFLTWTSSRDARSSDLSNIGTLKTVPHTFNRHNKTDICGF